MRSIFVLLFLLLSNHLSYATVESNTLIAYPTLLVTERGIIAHNFVIATVPPLAAGIWAAVATAGVIGGAIATFFGKSSSDTGDSCDEDYNYSYSYSPPPPKDPRNNDKYENMYELFDRTQVGQKLKGSVEPTRFSCQNSKIYRVTRNVPELGIKKGDWLYLDKMHGDHIEVFKRCGKMMRTILNMDGTQNLRKLAQAGVRSIEKCLR